MARVTLTDEVRQAVIAGRLDHLTTIDPDGGPQVSVVWIGPGVRFPPFDDPPPGHVIHLAAERIGGVGPWSD